MSEDYFWFPLVEDFKQENGWLINILPTKIKPKNSETEHAAVNLLFMKIDGSSFRVQKIYQPYFYVMEPFDKINQYYENKKVIRIEIIEKIDIGSDSGTRSAFKLVFSNVEDLINIRSEIRKYKCELREYDITYYERFCIDMDIRVGCWYDIFNNDGVINLKVDPTRAAPPQPRVLAFDIECSKEPLQFPKADSDEIMMISYIVDGIGYLVNNRKWFSRDIESFEYSPLSEYYCEFNVWNCDNEREMLQAFFKHIHQVRPHIFVTFNGDFFDWPFIESRAKICGLNLYEEIGFYNHTTEFVSRYAPHIDCFHWVQRDSYLPAGSQGLKAVTKAKLNYNPHELDPEDICPLGVEDPQRLANYSVSDAYATYYLYIKYVHPFIFSLATVIPLNSDDCLRKGTGTLCESLLMARAYHAGIFFPNKSSKDQLKTWEGHILLSETYSGGRVECLESGIFRDDIPIDFHLDPGQVQEVINRVPRILDFIINTELGIKKDDVENYEQIKTSIESALVNLRDNPVRKDNPVIIHLDVAAMYPNIILTNRLQPTAIVDESICSRCKMQSPDLVCQRKMKWTWRGEYFPSTSAQNHSVLRQLESETTSNEPWHSLSLEEQAKKYKERLTEFCRRAYQKTKKTTEQERLSIVCMKANSFYIDTVRSFRDRRYEFKKKLKVWNDKRAGARTPAEREEVKKMVVLYDSLQLAHKALLNSFYGYVMRGGARWRSMEMAGLVTQTGATIIKLTRQMVQGLGRPLELDTDGIWTAIPPTFPMNYQFQTKDGKRFFFSFPCSMLNENVDHDFSNHQYHQLNPTTGEWSVHKENSIFFEVDGPYHAMFLPAAKEEHKKLKKRYAVFNKNGNIHELKGFEIKRRGEWKMIKMLQSDAFKAFMYGSTTQEVYDHVADVCRQYLNVLLTKGNSIEDAELLNLLSESSTMSKSLAEYGDRKSTAATTARRLSEVLGESILQGSGLKCEYIISRLPASESIAGRAIPVIIFNDKPENIIMCLQRWCQDYSLKSINFRDIVDWGYYTERLHSALQKILIIPSILQGIKIRNFNVPPPDWVIKKQREEKLKIGQTKLHFSPATTSNKPVKEKFKRDESNLSDYQITLIEAKKNWRLNRVEITRPILQKHFSEWRVLEIRGSSQPGIVSVYAQSGVKEIQKLDVSVPRVFYINSTYEMAEKFESFLGSKTKRVKKHLPHSFVADVVTQFTISETEFLRSKAEFTSSFNSPGVHGVYETQVTPLFRALCTIGASVSTFKKLNYSLSDMKSSKKPLSPEFSELNRVFIYSCMSHGKGIIAFVPMMSGEAITEAQVFAFYKHDVELNTPSLRSIQEASISRVIETNGLVKLAKYNVSHFQKVREAANALQNALVKFGRVDSTVVFLQSHLNLDQLISNLSVSSLHMFPVVTIDFPNSDSFLDDTQQVWHLTAFENFTTRFLQLPFEIKTKMQSSSLLNAPMGNIFGDYCMNSLDLLFARKLISSDYLLWYSETSEPDIGNAYSNLLISMPGDPFISLSTNRKGAYLNKSTEFRVTHLATCAVLESQSLIDRLLPQHSVPSSSDFNALPSIDAITVVQPAFKVLSHFLGEIISECSTDGNILSSMCGHIGTWLSSSSSSFYDPAIHSVFFHFLTILFNEMVNYFDDQHLTVVYADQSRLIINTGTFPYEKAIDGIKQKPLFSWTDFSFVRSYDKLVWIDEYNFQGLLTNQSFIANWNVRNFLSGTLSTFLTDFFNDLLIFDADKIPDFFTDKKDDMFKLASIAKTKPEVTPNNLRNPNDESNSDFILLMNTIFHPLDNFGSDIDQNITKIIQKLRRNVLTIIGHGEFSSRTKYVDPSRHLEIPSVLCEHCLSVRNIDILRDEEILNGNWICSFCQQPYNIGLLEKRLFEEFSRRYEAYQNQDLVCAHCGKPQARKLCTICADDGGKLVTRENRESLQYFMETLEIAARALDLSNLSQVISVYRSLSK